MKKRHRILFVAYPNNIHTVRWISQLSGSNYEVYLFPCIRIPVNNQFKNVTIFSADLLRPKNLDRSVRWVGFTSLAFYIDLIIQKGFRLDNRSFFTIHALNLIIKLIKPDIVHSLELQHSGYLTLQVKNKQKFRFPKWIISIWGSDLFLFSRLQFHNKLIKNVLANADYLQCENPRDDQLAINLGFKGKVLPNLPGPGGFDFSLLNSLTDNKPSDRKVILLKGYQNWSGRALVGLVALSKCVDVLEGFELKIFNATPDVEIAAELFSQDYQIKTTIIEQLDYIEFVKLYQKSRIIIGLSISDGVPNTMLEAMAFGVFPIQSNTAYTSGWIDHGRTGFVVPPEDPDVISGFIRTSLSNNKLVDKAAKLNELLIKKKLDSTDCQQRITHLYKDILSNK